MGILPQNNVKVESAIQADRFRQYHFKGKYVRKIDGGKMFRYCLKTSVISLAEFEESTTYKIDGTNNLKLKIVQNSVYIEALNMKNALKRLEKRKIAFAV